MKEMIKSENIILYILFYFLSKYAGKNDKKIIFFFNSGWS